MVNAPELMKRQRQRLGLSRNEVGRQAGISGRQYCYVESGERLASPKTLFAIAQVLHLPPETLIAAADLSPRDPQWWPTEKAYALCRKESA